MLASILGGRSPAARSVLICLALAGCAAPKPPPPAPPPVPAPVPIPPPPARIEPPNFSGLAPDALRARLGTPQFSRKDGPTEMWRYDTRTCHAFFFFTGNQVGHVETIPRGSDNAADPGCLISLRKTS